MVEELELPTTFVATIFDAELFQHLAFFSVINTDNVAGGVHKNVEILERVGVQTDLELLHWPICFVAVHDWSSVLKRLLVHRPTQVHSSLRLDSELVLGIRLDLAWA